MTISVAFPAAAHLRLFGSQLSSLDKAINFALVLVGFLLAVVGTVVTI